ncbi:dynein regulatory complex subunit 2-like [Hetaerina americana]|uniref:dynein regulatory complex subunit 2-like n=1 Tax=Hetaerina americana TaxID=62018 RepID=UPI003A7F237D
MIAAAAVSMERVPIMIPDGIKTFIENFGNGFSNKYDESLGCHVELGMGPKKKGKAGKFARMTDEERARYLQHRAALEEEARRRKQELVFTFLKSKFKKEDAFARINLAKIHQQWRQILRNIKIVELKEEVEVKCQNPRVCYLYLCTTEPKNGGREWNKDEAVAPQPQPPKSDPTISYITEICGLLILILLQGERLSVLHKEYVNKKNELLKNGRKRLQDCKTSNFMAQEHIRVIIHASETKFLRSETEAKGEFITRTTDWKNVSDNEQNVMMSIREAKIEALAKIYKNTTNEYFISTEERRKHYTTLKAKDDLNCAMIENQSKRLVDDVTIVRCYYPGVIIAMLSHMKILTEKLKEQLLSLRKAYDMDINNLKAERHELSVHFSQLRNTSQMMVKLDKEKVIHVTVASNKANKNLENLIERAKQILRLAQSCRRFETIQEKVINPVINNNKPENSLMNIGEIADEETSNWLKSSLTEYGQLDGFWKRFNKALMERATLKLHLSALSVENEQLKAALKHYFCSISPSSCMIKEGVTRHSAVALMKDKDTKCIMETTPKKIIPREKYYQNRPRPVTSVDGRITIRNYSLF